MEVVKMDEHALIRARKRAEGAIKDMREGPLKIAAFQTILSNLLAESAASAPIGHKATNPKPGRQRQPDTLSGRLLAIKSDGVFSDQRTLGEVREALGARGWHYPVTTLSGAMQALVRDRQLRRERVSVGGKKLWKYSNA
jgi:hypothetical protein